MLRPGRNIAIKVPLYRYEETVAFYRDRVGLPVSRTLANSTGFGFGAVTLWVDRVPHQSQQDVWVELFSGTPAEVLAKLGSPRRDELEPLDGVTGTTGPQIVTAAHKRSPGERRSQSLRHQSTCRAALLRSLGSNASLVAA